MLFGWVNCAGENLAFTFLVCALNVISLCKSSFCFRVRVPSMKPFRLKWCCRDLMVFSSDSLGSINVAPEKRGGTRLWEEWADADMAFWPTKCINFSFPPALCPYFWLGPCYSLFVLENCGWTHSIRFIFWGACTAIARNTKSTQINRIECTITTNLLHTWKGIFCD